MVIISVIRFLVSSKFFHLSSTIHILFGGGLFENLVHSLIIILSIILMKLFLYVYIYLILMLSFDWKDMNSQVFNQMSNVRSLTNSARESVTVFDGENPWYTQQKIFILFSFDTALVHQIKEPTSYLKFLKKIIYMLYDVDYTSNRRRIVCYFLKFFFF